MSECAMFRLKFRLEKDAISTDPILDFLQHPTTHHPPTIKAPPKNKNQQNNAFCLSLIDFLHKVHNIKIEMK